MARIRKGIDPNNLKIIPESEVPPPTRASTPYRKILKKISKGSALVLSEREVSLATARAAIRTLQKRGEFKDFTITQRTIDGEKKLYIIHEGKESDS